MVRQIPLAQAEYSWLGGSLCKLGQWCGIPCLWHLWEYSVHSLVTRLNFHEVFYQHSCTPLFVCMHKRHINSLWWTMHVWLPHCGGLIQYIYFFSVNHSHKSMKFFESPTTKQNMTHPTTAISNTFSDSMTSCPVGCGLSWPVFYQWAAKKSRENKYSSANFKSDTWVSVCSYYYTIVLRSYELWKYNSNRSVATIFWSCKRNICLTKVRTRTMQLGFFFSPKGGEEKVFFQCSNRYSVTEHLK